MKKAVSFVTILAVACIISVPASAQLSQNRAGWSTTMASSMRAGNGTVGAQADTESRLNGQTREEAIAQAVYEDRQKLKEVKRLLKEAKSDEEREQLKQLKADLERHIVELQQG